MSEILGWGLAVVMMGAWGCSGAPAPTIGAESATAADDAGDAAIVDRDAKPANVPEAGIDAGACPNGRAYCCQASGACGCYTESFCAYDAGEPAEAGPPAVIITCITDAGAHECTGLTGDVSSDITYQAGDTNISCMVGAGAPTTPCTHGGTCTVWMGFILSSGTCP